MAGIPGANLGVDTIQRFGERPARRGFEASESTTGLVEFRRQVFEARPTPPKPEPKPEPVVEIAEEPAESTAATSSSTETTETSTATQETTTSATPAGSITEIIYAAAANHGLEGAYLVSIAECESSLDPNAVSPAGYHGLFQYDYTTWGEFGYGSIYDPVAQSETTASLIAAGQSSRWPNCA